MSYPDRCAKLDAWKVYITCQCGFDEHACGAKIYGAVSGILLKESRPVGWNELLPLSSQLTCWSRTRVAHAFPVAPVVSARCPGVVCWTVMVPLHHCMRVPLVFWAPARCGTHVTDDLFGCPLCAASVFMERQVQAYGGTAASFLFVSCLRRIPMCLFGLAAAS